MQCTPPTPRAMCTQATGHAPGKIGWTETDKVQLVQAHTRARWVVKDSKTEKSTAATPSVVMGKSSTERKFRCVTNERDGQEEHEKVRLGKQEWACRHARDRQCMTCAGMCHAANTKLVMAGDDSVWRSQVVWRRSRRLPKICYGADANPSAGSLCRVASRSTSGRSCSRSPARAAFHWFC